MNYYPRYPGDYLIKTVGITMIEDGAYTRLLDWYYSNEEPIDHEGRYEVARATTTPAKEAVDKVLRRFFIRDGEVWRHGRADEEIAKAAPRIEAAKANGSRGGRKPKKNPPGNPTENPPGSPTGNPPGNPDGTQRASSPEPAPAPELPLASQAPAASTRVEVGKAMRRAGLDPMSFNVDDPRAAALIAQGATPAEFEGLAREALAKGVGKPWGWILAVLPQRRSEAATIALAAPVAATVPSDQAERTAEYLRERSKPFTPEEKAAADEARKRVMAAVNRSAA